MRGSALTWSPLTGGARDNRAVGEDVAALRLGDPEALRMAYEEHHVVVRAFARRLVGDDALAEDLVHDTFVALPAALRGFRGDATLRTFLIGIAVNHARHAVRAAARARAATERLAREPNTPVAQPDESLARRELAAALLRALDTLPLEQRVVFVLCEVESRTSREAAAIVGAPDPTVRARLRLAKEKLRAALEEEGFR